MARVLLCTTPKQPFHTLTTLFPDLSPHGLQVLASILRNAGHEVEIADLEQQGNPDRQLQSLIKARPPDVVGFSNNCLPNTPVILQLARRLKSKLPSARFIAGGEVPTARPEYYLEGPDAFFDAVCQGEGELVIVPLVEALAAGRDLTDLPGVAWRRADGGMVTNARADIIHNLDELPMPAWEGTLKDAPFSPGLSASIETARGCPYVCSFCSIPGYFGKKPRHKSVDRIMSELRHLKAAGVTEVSFIDDSFATDLKRARELFEGMIRENMNLGFGVQIRADIVAQNPDLIALAARAGLMLAVVGFEGYSARAQKDANKGNSLEINREASRILRANRVCVYGTHIFGGPGMRMSDNLMTFVLGRYYSDVFRMTIYTPLLGSRVFDELMAEGKILTSDPRAYYYGSYVIKDSHNPTIVKFSYFGLQLLHYALPGTWFRTLLSRNRVVRAFNRRAYRGAFEFVLGEFAARIRSVTGGRGNGGQDHR